MLFNCKQYKKKEISTFEDVLEFTNYLVNSLKVNIHPDADFREYINYSTGDRTFTEEEAIIGNKLMGDCFNVCSKENIDIYDIMSNIFEHSEQNQE